MVKAITCALAATVLFLGFTQPVAAAAKEAAALEQQQREKLEKQNSVRRSELNTTMLFYGRVVDFDGNPVPGATVTMRRTYVPFFVFSGDQELVTAETDERGEFMLEESGFSLYLVEIARDGYQFSMAYNKERNFAYQKGKGLAGPGSRRDQAMDFLVRKKAPPAVVLGTWIDWQLSPEQVKLLDLYRLDWSEPMRVRARQISFKDWNPDLRVQIEGERGNSRLVLEALDPDSGFARAKARFIEELTEAPEHGYQPRLVLSPTRGKDAFYYVKSAGGLFYSKIGISYNDLGERVRVKFDIATNKEGGRALEFDLNYNVGRSEQYRGLGRSHLSMKKL